MPITFYNIKSGETRVVATSPDDVKNPDDFDARYVEAKIAALYNSSDLGVNARAGQDFGWRLAPTMVKKLREIRRDDELVRRIAAQIAVPEENLEDSNILYHIAREDARAARRKAEDAEIDHEKAYNDELRDLDQEDDSSDDTPAATTTPKKAAPKQSAAQKKAAAKQKADEKRRAENIEAGRDLNDGIETDDTGDGLDDPENPETPPQE
jgi:hypothetical protein